LSGRNIISLLQNWQGKLILNSPSLKNGITLKTTDQYNCCSFSLNEQVLNEKASDEYYQEGLFRYGY
jgi:hypothetical protein